MNERNRAVRVMSALALTSFLADTSEAGSVTTTRNFIQGSVTVILTGQRSFKNNSVPPGTTTRPRLTGSFQAVAPPGQGQEVLLRISGGASGASINTSGLNQGGFAIAGCSKTLNFGDQPTLMQCTTAVRWRANVNYNE